MWQFNRATVRSLALLAIAGVGIAAPAASAQLLAGVDEDAEYVRLYDFTRGRWVRQFLPADSADQLTLLADGPSAIAVDEANHIIYWMDGTSLYRSDYGSGATTFVATVTYNDAPMVLSGLEFVDGVLYGADNAPDTPTPEAIYTVDAATGVSTIVLDLTANNLDYLFKALAYNPQDGLFYVTNGPPAAGPTGLLSIDVLGTGAVNFVTGFGGAAGEGTDVDGLAIGVQNGVARAYFVHDQAGEYSVYNFSTGLFEAPLPGLPLAGTEINSGAAWAPGLVAPMVDNDVLVRLFDAPDFIVAGDQLTYTVEVENNGTTPLSNVVVATTLDSRTSFASSTEGSHDGAGAGGVHTAAFPTIPALGLVTYEVVVTVNSGGELVASAAATTGGTDPDTTNNSAATQTEALDIPMNDLCAGAIPLTCGDFAFGDTRAATPDSMGTCGVTDGNLGGVWYSFLGTGAEVSASTCNPGSDFNTRLRVWEGTCDNLICVGGNDTSADPTGCQVGTFNQLAKFTWTTTPGQTYYILAHGAFSNIGHVELTLTCVDPHGACCSGMACSVMTEGECAGIGGAYQGSGTTCTPPTMTDAEPGEFIDIADTGTPLGLVDDLDVAVATTLLGDLRIDNNGAVAFSSFGSADSEGGGLPSTGLFGREVEAFAVYWDNLDADFGEVYWQELADRVIVQWQNRPHSEGEGLDEGVTFQVQLFPPGAPYRAQYVYTDTTFDPDMPEIDQCSLGACDDGASATVGWQNGQAQGGDFVLWSAGESDIVGRPCPCELDHAAGVNVFDLLAYLDAWFAAAPEADIDGTPGVNVFDLLAYLDCWFPASAGEPCGQTTILTIVNPPACP